MWFSFADVLIEGAAANNKVHRCVYIRTSINLPEYREEGE